MNISQSDFGDAGRVKVSGRGLSEGCTSEPAEFIIDTSAAGEQLGTMRNLPFLSLGRGGTEDGSQGKMACILGAKGHVWEL